MRTLPCFLIPTFLAAQVPGMVDASSLEAHTPLGSDPTSQIRLVPDGCWTGLMLSVTARPAHPAHSTPSRRRMAEAVVEVWDVAFQESSRQETFRMFKEALLLSLRSMWRFAPPSHSRIDAAIRAGNGSCAGTDMAMVQSLQQRFNALPPNGSPVKPGATRYR